jgi:V8-like Glu-specific endopeptidase
MTRSPWSRRNLRVVALLFVWVLALAAPLQAQSPHNVFVPLATNGSDDENPFRVVQIDPAVQAAGTFEWTAEAMAAATPLRPTSLLSEAEERALAARLDAVDAKYRPVGLGSGMGRGALPQPEAEAALRAQNGAVQTAMTEAEMDANAPAAVDGTSAIYTVYLGNYFTQFHTSYPFRTIGRLFSSGGSCTASVVRPYVIVTAAHCVYNTTNNTWFTNFNFVPAYRNGAAPYGAWQPYGGGVWILNGYIGLPSWSIAAGRYDIAVLRMVPKNGVPIGNAVGYLGYYYGDGFGKGGGYIRNITEVGYPSNLPDGSRYTYFNHAESYYFASDVLGYGGISGAGASGSPAMIRFSPFRSGSYNQVQGVGSGVNLAGQYLTTARFMAWNFRTLCNAAGCGIP